MIGNDIVDLEQAAIESNWKRRGFLDKLFTPEEQQLLFQGQLAPEVMIWLLWTMKESAYKIYNRVSNIRSFAPAKLICHSLSRSGDRLEGKVSFAAQEYVTETVITTSYIHTIASTTPQGLENIRVEISEYYQGYRSKLPQSVSHHGRYLALAYS